MTETTERSKWSAVVFWWHMGEGAETLRYWLVFLGFLILLMCFTMHWVTANKLAAKNIIPTKPALYVPRVVSSGNFNAKELSVVTLKTRLDLLNIDTGTALHFVEQSDYGSDGLYVTHYIKPSNESTHYYTYVESVAPQKIDNGLIFNPKLVKFASNDSTVDWVLEYYYSGTSTVLIFLISLAATIVLGTGWNRLLKKKWTKAIN